MINTFADFSIRMTFDDLLESSTRVNLRAYRHRTKSDQMQQYGTVIKKFGSVSVLRMVD